MNQKKLPSTPFKDSSQNSPLHNLNLNFPKSAHSKNLYRKFSDFPAATNTPDASLFQQFSTNTTTKCLTKLDFSSTGDKDKQMTNLFLQRKLKQDQNEYDEDNDIQVSDFTLALREHENIKKEKPNPFHEFQKTIATPKKEVVLAKPFHEEIIKEEYEQPKQKQPLIKRWKINDKIFEGKYSTGATPKVFKSNAPPAAYSSYSSLSLTTLTRSNSDVPSTSFESKLKLEGMKEGLGDNKYLQNLNKNSKIPVISGLGFNERNSHQESKLSEFQERKCTKNLFPDFEPEAIEESPFENSMVPEKIIDENNFLSKRMESRGSLEKVLMYNDEYNSPRSKDGLDYEENFKEDSDGSFHTPPKNQPSDQLAENLLSSTAKKEPSKKFHSQFSNSTDVPDKGFTEKKYDNWNTKKAEKHKPATSSRFTEDYKILETLGTGNFGTVYKCQNKLDGLIYAIKCTQSKFKGSSNGQAINEAQALASLSALDENPFIVRYYNAWTEDNRLFLVMEHCQSNLNALRHEYVKFNESMIRHIMRDICMGLKHLHKQRIVHLDIKPENILYSKTSKYKIADLGMSRIAYRSNGEDVNEGDCRYLAQEVLNDYNENSIPDLTKADIFSFGATMYELMTGTDLPKNGPEWHALRAGDLHKLDHLNYSNSLKSIIKAMMNANPDLRPSAHELLTNFLQSEIELELKWEKEQNAILRKKIKELESKLKIERKKSY